MNKIQLDCYISIDAKRKLDELRSPHFSIEQMLEKLIDEEYREFELAPEHYRMSFSECRNEFLKNEKENEDFYNSLPDD